MSAASEIMSQRSICVMGNGACSTECPLELVGKKLFEEIPIGTDLSTISEEARQAVWQAGGLTIGINKLNTSGVIKNCIKENPLR